MAEISFKSVGEQLDSFVNREQDVSPTPIGISTPLRLSTTQKDIFEMNYNLQDQIEDNMRNLILTNHGERLGLYDFGANLKPILFSLSNNSFESDAMIRIKTATQKFLPFIELETFEISFDNRNTSPTLATVVLVIGYGIPAIGVTGKKMKVLLTAGG